MQAFSSTPGLDRLCVAIWQLSRRIKETSHLILSGNVTSKDTSSPPSRRDSVGEAGVDLALSSLVNETQRVLDASRGSFFGIISVEEYSSAPMLADKYLSLVRVLVAAAIHPHSTSLAIHQSEEGLGSNGSMSVSSARLLKDILVRFDLIQSAVISHQTATPTSSSSVDEVENMRVTLHAAVPEHLLSLCRLLDPSNFASLFNSQETNWLPLYSHLSMSYPVLYYATRR